MAKQQSKTDKPSAKKRRKESDVKLSLGDIAECIQPKIEEEAAIEVVILNDPLWSPALEALQKSGELKGIAELLKISSPPDWVAKEIGIMMSPPKGYRGLVITIDKRKDQNKRQKAINDIMRKIEIRKLLIEAGAEKNLKRALFDVGQKVNLERTTLMEAWTFKGKERTLRSLKMLGYVQDDAE